MRDIRQTPQYTKYLSLIGWKVERIHDTNYFIKKFPIIGSVLKVQRPEKLHLHDIYHVSRANQCFQIIIEPNLSTDHLRLASSGFKSSNSPYLPTKTLQLDLTKSENQLLKEMKKDARYALRRTMNFILCTVDCDDFRHAWKKAVGWKRYVPPLSHLIALEKSFKDNCVFLGCFDESIHRSGIIGGAIFLIGDKTVYYWQAFTNEEGRKALAQYKIVWEGILWAKETDAKVFDFEGIYDERFPNKSWLGFTHFKKSFGGYEVSYPGCFVKNLLSFSQ